jgi:tRNA nucleotidyltransferase/poly(A) polymerase
MTAGLAGAAFLREPALRALLDLLNAPEPRGAARVVGGAVRNALMGLPVADVDLATIHPPAEVERRAAASGLHVIPTGVAFGTVTVLAGGAPFEVTTLRRDISTDGRRAVVAFGTDWAEDAARRDFTMNALYCDADGAVFDPLGGLPDIEARRVRFIGEADTRIAEDHLRALRFFRFHASYGDGELDEPGFRACVRARPLMARLSAERVRQELMKLVVAPRAAEALERLAETGIAADVAGPLELGRFARLAALEAGLGLPPSAVLRLWALAVRVEEDAARLGRRLRLSRAEEALLALLAREAPPLARALGRSAGRRALYRAGEDYPLVALAAWAAARRDPREAALGDLLALPDTAPVPPFPLRGADLVALGLAPGPEVGRALAEAERRWIASDFSLGREALLAALGQAARAGRSSSSSEPR